MAVSEKGHLLFLATQINKINLLPIIRDKSWEDLTYFHFIGASTFVLTTMHLATHSKQEQSF
jgi:hypothetical protein